jgi:hypothetical protein
LSQSIYKKIIADMIKRTSMIRCLTLDCRKTMQRDFWCLSVNNQQQS